ncbi:SMP-30/gluconolactonase/LRE family protein [Dehalococcoidia bacterium]|nr:SMP-30/gluconolactonase/LRE family protein [Dehalococcoidia bacterium]
MPDTIDQLVESSKAERLATGFEFTEGPLWHPEGHLLFVNNRINRIYRLEPGGEPEVIRENSGAANGLTFDLQGRLIMCEGDNRQITRMEPDGSLTVIADRLDGKRLNRPNDVVCRSDGSIYFTDPGGRLSPADREIGFNGVHRIAPNGTVSTVTTDLESPNGLTFSPDERILYADNTRRDDECVQEKERGEVCTHQYIRAYDVAPDGSLSNSRIFANMPSAEDGVPDGMKVDTDGRVYCTGSEGVWVFEPNGNHVGIIRLPEIPANCAWGDADYRTMYFTARSSVYRLRMKTTGISPWRNTAPLA